MTKQYPYTPGPWAVDTAKASAWIVTCPQRGFEDVPEVRGKVCEVGYRPNAYLIAAAPQMLEALQAVAAAESRAQQLDARSMVRAAIAAAEYRA